MTENLDLLNTAVSYRLRLSLSWCGIGGVAYRLDELWVQAVPSGTGGLAKAIVALIESIGPLVGSQIVPQVFHRVQLGRVWRQVHAR